MALKLPRSVWILPPELAPTAGAVEGLGVADGRGVADGLGVGDGVGDGEGEGLGLGEGLGDGEGVKITDGEGEENNFLSETRDFPAVYIANPPRITTANIIGKEIIPKLFNLGIKFMVSEKIKKHYIHCHSEPRTIRCGAWNLFS